MARPNLEQYVIHEVQRFADYLRAEKRTAATIGKYPRHLETFLSFVGKHVEQIAKADMQAWKADLAGRYCENSMVPMICAVNCYMVRVAERPELKMQPPKWVDKDVIPMTETEVMAFLKEAKKPMLGEPGHRLFETCCRDYLMACLMYYAGLRASEVGNLRISGLDLDRKMLRVHEGKEKNYGIVLLNDVTVQAIRDYLAFTRAQIKVGSGFEDRLILTEKGKPIGRNQVWETVKRIGIRAGIEKNIYPHLFRHTMATRMAEQGLNAFEIQAQTRHKHLETVQKYVHISEQARRTAYERVFGPEKRPQDPALAPSSRLGPQLFAQGSPEVIVMTQQQLEQVIHAAIGVSGKPIPGYQ